MTHKPKVNDHVRNPDYDDQDEDSVFARPILSVRSKEHIVIIRSFDNEDQTDHLSFSKLRRENGEWHITAEPQLEMMGRAKLPYGGVFNWHGTVVRLETRAVSAPQARSYLMRRVAEAVKQPPSTVTAYYKERPKAYEIKPLNGDEAPSTS
jgi:hypothetical protein